MSYLYNYIYRIRRMAILAGLALLVMHGCGERGSNNRFSVGIDNNTNEIFETAYVEGLGFRSIALSVYPDSGFTHGPIFRNYPIYS